jgi:hypothetical protein
LTFVGLSWFAGAGDRTGLEQLNLVLVVVCFSFFALLPRDDFNLEKFRRLKSEGALLDK